MLKQDAIEDILDCPTLPSLPAVAVRVIELTRDDNVSLDELALTIQNDQGLASKVLRTVNSSYYGLREKCGTIRKALVVLGLNAVKSLALGFSLVEALKTPPDEEDPFDYLAYWRRGLYTGVGARSVAAAARCREADEAFLAGLLQDVGMFAMMEGLGREYLDVYLAAGGRDHRKLAGAELEAFELTHAEIGAMLTNRWRLPDDLVVPVRYHENASAAPKEHATIARAVALGNIAHDVLTDEEPAKAVAAFRRQCLKWFEIEKDVADGLLDEIARGAAEMSSLFQLDTGTKANAAKVLEEARELSVEMAFAREKEREETLESLTTGEDRFDPITGMLNAAAGQSLFNEVFAEAKQGLGTFSTVRVVLTGLPAFEGLEAIEADRQVIAAVVILKKHFDPMGGVVVRTGDNRFDVCVSGGERDAVVKIADRFKDEVLSTRDSWAPSGSGHGPIGVSIGVACYDRSTSGVFGRAEHLTIAADRAAMAAEAAGGGCVRVFRPRAAA